MEKFLVLRKCIYFQNNIAENIIHSRYVFLTYINKSKMLGVVKNEGLRKRIISKTRSEILESTINLKNVRDKERLENSAIEIFLDEEGK